MPKIETSRLKRIIKNVKAHLSVRQVSPNGKLVAYAQDTKGDEIYTVYVIDAESGKYVGQPLEGITYDIKWAGDDYLVYVTMNAILRPDKVWLHMLGSDQSNDIRLYHEKDDMFSLGLRSSESKQTAHNSGGEGAVGARVRQGWRMGEKQELGKSLDVTCD
uniref:Peptidase S9A N-terminal domain-containing protein n=1 Tax=Oryza brachyantha TaxID=4533 RepID=J3L2I2_ORYBR